MKSENFLNKVDRYLAAKSNYFGVGGGTMLFEDFIEEMDKFDKELCENIEAGMIFISKMIYIVLYFSSSCVLYVVGFSVLSIFDCPSVFSNDY